MNKNMRKMYTEEEVVNLIKKANSDGDIKLGTKIYLHLISDTADLDFVKIYTTQKEKFDLSGHTSLSLMDEEIISMIYIDDDNSENYLSGVIDFGDDDTSVYCNGTRVHFADGHVFVGTENYYVNEL